MQDTLDAVLHHGATDILDAPGIDFPAEHGIVANDTQIEDGILPLASPVHGVVVADVDEVRIVSIRMRNDVRQRQLVLLRQPGRDGVPDVTAGAKDDQALHSPPPFPAQTVANVCSNSCCILGWIRKRGFGGLAHT